MRARVRVKVKVRVRVRVKARVKARVRVRVRVRVCERAGQPRLHGALPRQRLALATRSLGVSGA